ncbi:MAG: Gfo/Idh/MocA family oxidoreductase [Akkermansiaceae bacterium]|nr:Gfo/Idh/MocA family oxidoreductase [Akkermansiaceae bacterium]MCP5551371.1 Gfo/Idh/MocA family oxidoreductase [Akkermansiaceae bacterium]
MSENSTPNPTSSPLQTASRREAIKTGSLVAAAGASVLSGVAIPHVHAQGNEELKLSLVGCGGRGTGAVKNALSVSGSLGPLKLHAMADVFEDKLSRSHETLVKDPQVGDKIDVSPDRQFIGFDGYKHAMDALKAGDIVILTTPCAFRWPMFEYAIEKGLNVFMEKPLCPDGYSARKLLELNQKAKEKNLKVGVGLMCRHCKSRNELKKRIEDGAIGDIEFLRSYRMQGRIGSCFTAKNDTGMPELHYQIRNFHSFIWLSGGSYSDFFIHGIDEMCMMKNAWPVKAHAVGGRHYKQIDLNGKMVDAVDQNFDSYGVEYTFEDGARAFYYGRNMEGCKQEFAAYAHGTKGSAVISTSSHVPARSRIYSDQNIDYNYRATPENLVWAFPMGPRGASLEGNPYDIEWEDLMEAIRNDKPYNEVDRGVAASVVTSMGRMAAHTGQEITYDQMLNSEHQMAPGVENLTMDSDSPLMPDENGRYPIPEPGVKKDREY